MDYRIEVHWYDKDRNHIELIQDSDENQIELVEIDQKRSGLQNNDKNRSALLESIQSRNKLQDNDQNRIELRDGDLNRSGLQNNDQNRNALLESSQNLIESQDSNENQLELLDTEHNTNSMNVKEPEDENSVKELINTETDALKLQEAVSETNIPNGKMVPSKLYTKHVKKIFIHGLGQETKEEDIRKVFEEAGEVVEVKVILNFKTGKKEGSVLLLLLQQSLRIWLLPNTRMLRYVEDHVEHLLSKGLILSYSIISIRSGTKNMLRIANHKDHPCTFGKLGTKSKILVVESLQNIGIKKLDEVLVVPDPDNAKLNCGFAFLEFETKRDAQIAYHKLHNENVFGKRSNIKVSWASSSVDPVEEETHNNKSVYAEHIPLSWDEKEVNDHFKTFGEIESIALAKNLLTAKRNDFAFINYKTCEAAHSCIEALTCKKSTSNIGPTGQLKVSLAKSIPKVKPMKTVSGSAVTEVSHAYPNTNRSRQSHNQYQNVYQLRQSQQKSSYDSYLGVYKPPQKSKFMIGKREDSRNNLASSTTAELVQLLREQASWKQGHHQPSFGGKQPFTELERKSTYHHDPRAYHQSHLQIPNATHHRPIVNVTSIPHYDQQRVHYESGSLNISNPDRRYIQVLQRRDQTTYPGSSTMYRQMH